MPNPKVTVGLLLDRLRASLQLEEIEPGSGLDRIVGNPEVSSPGLVLAGYVKRFSAERLQVLGETEITYLQSLSTADRKKILELFFSFPIPAVFVTKGQRLPAGLKEMATRELDVPDWGLPHADLQRIQYLPIDRVARYCAKDAYYSLDLMRRQQQCLV